MLSFFTPKDACLFFIFWVDQKQSGNMVEELNRMSTENKKLTQMLTSMCENYSVLQSQLVNLLNQTPNSENGHENPKKREACFEATASEEIQGISEYSCISYEDSCKRARLLNCKPKVSKILVRSEKSDTKLVCTLGINQPLTEIMMWD